MNILMTGGTGFIGSALVENLKAQGHQLTILSRTVRPSQQAVKFIQNFANLQDLNDFDAVINLAGEPIFAKRWAVQQKQILTASRVNLTTQLAELINRSSTPPHTFLSGSAIGFYGDLPPSANFYAESTACGTNFTAKLCQQWEKAALKAVEKTRVCLLRTGTVLDPKGGALKAMLPLYRWGFGGKLGSGKQYWAWFSLEDYLQAVIFLLENAKAQGAFNMAAPAPATNAEFNHWLAKQCHRPAIFNTPAFALKCILGERACLLLDNQPIVPKKLQDLGFSFQHNRLDELSL